MSIQTCNRLGCNLPADILTEVADLVLCASHYLDFAVPGVRQ